MKVSKLGKTLPVLMVISALGLTASPTFSQETIKGKAEGKQKVQIKQNHGREAGEMPYGLIRHTENKGGLPAGLQKKKAENGQLPHGLEEGGKSLKSTGKGKRASK
jgi:hypothetical protein